MTLVSVVIPSYNRRNLLEGTINSVLAQTYKYLEIVVSDDGSTDGTHALVQEFSRRDQRVKYIYSSNSERSIARNRAILECSGEFIAFVDADDCSDNNKIELQLRAISCHKDVKCSFHRYKQLASDEIIPPSNNLLFEVESSVVNLFPSIVFDNPIGSMTPLIHRSIFAEVGLFTTEPNLIGFEDWDLWTRISAKYKWLEVPLVLGYWRSHPGNTQRTIKPQEEIIRLYSALSAARAAMRSYEIEHAVLVRAFDLYNEVIKTDVECARQFLSLATGLESVKPSFHRQLLSLLQLINIHSIRNIFPGIS